jgi:hypothetical protein
MKNLIIALLLAFSVTSIIPAAEAEKGKTTAKGKAPSKGKAKGNTYPLYGEVVSVTTKTLTIKGGEGKEDRKFTISSTTKIHNDGKPATIEDVKVGKKVGGSVEKETDKLLSLNVGAAQSAAKPKAPKGKAKSE